MSLSNQQSDILETIEKRIYDLFESEATGHDFFHVMRVVDTTYQLQSNEDLFRALLIAYFHDVFDDKLKRAYPSLNALLKAWDISLPYDTSELEDEILSIGFKGGFNTTQKTPEAKLVSDADLMDAMGAIGIARTFYYAGSKGTPLYDPRLNHVKVDSYESYRNTVRNAIDHFDEKLLRLYDVLETEKARELARSRHDVLVAYVKQFRDEMRSLDKYQTQ